jgi:hypothetical protein
MSSTGSARTRRQIIIFGALHGQQCGTIEANQLNGTHAVVMYADDPASKGDRPAVRPLQGTFNIIVGVVIVQSV